MADVTIHDLTAATNPDVLTGSVMEIELGVGTGKSRKITTTELLRSMLRLGNDDDAAFSVDGNGNPVVKDASGFAIFGTNPSSSPEVVSPLYSQSRFTFDEYGNPAIYLDPYYTVAAVVQDNGVRLSRPLVMLDEDGVTETATLDRLGHMNVGAANFYDAKTDGASVTWAWFVGAESLPASAGCDPYGNLIGNSIALAQSISAWGATAPGSQPTSPMTIAALTDSTGGTPGGTLADVTATPSQGIINDNFASLNAQINDLVSQVVELTAIIESYGLSAAA